MRLTVDASVVIKWSVPETLSANARMLRTHRLHLHAPDLLLAECVNVLWKKRRRGEIVDVSGHLDEVLRLPNELTLHPIARLLGQAGQLSLRLDHPVYDCLYLACAEDTESVLVTADRRLANKVADSGLPITFRYLGADDFATDIGAVATAPVVEQKTVEALMDAYRLLVATGERVREEGEGVHGASNPAGGEPGRDSVAYRRLAAQLRELSDEERIDLLALGWFGQPDGPDWRWCHEQACRELTATEDGELIRSGRFWKRGYERLFAVAT